MSTETKKLEPRQVDSTDWFLQILVGMANRSNFEFGITLQVSGMLVSGSLVNGKEYFEGFAADFAGAYKPDDEAGQSISKHFSSLGEIYATNEELDDDRPQPQYIHLKNARFFNTAGNPIPGNRGVWWRGRICEVGGFSLGSLSA